MAKSAASEKQIATPPADLVSWLEGDKNYALGIEAGKLVCRNPAGKKLASVPKELKESELAEQLRALCEWLDDHRTECLRRVEMWMLRSLPVPCDVVRAVWPDPDWSDMLRNLVVTPVDAQGKADATQTGLLRDIDAKKGIGVVDRDGETQWIAAAQILIPHPILIDGLVELREIAADMGFSQAIEQLFRPTFAATKEQKELSRIMDFSGGRFEQLNFASSRLPPARLSRARGLCVQQDLGERHSRRGTLLDRRRLPRGGDVHGRADLRGRRPEAAADRRRGPGHVQRGCADGLADLCEAQGREGEKEATHEHGHGPARCRRIAPFQDEGRRGRDRTGRGPDLSSSRAGRAPGDSPGLGSPGRGGRPGDGVPGLRVRRRSRRRSRCNSAGAWASPRGP